MNIKEAVFVKSAVKPGQYPDDPYPEIAFAGRSNVGKSSLINTLVRRKRLVKTSSKPGCTRLINFFLVNGAFSFVDLPGYGYAKASKAERAKWKPMVEQYLLTRETLLGLVLLLDIRRDPGQEEKALAEWLLAGHIPCLMVLTKSDKLSRNNQIRRRKMIGEQVGRPPEHLILFSSRSGLGREEVLLEINRLKAEYDDAP